jgi:hypothetical protein
MPKPLIHAHYKGWASMDPEGIYGLKADVLGAALSNASDTLK